MIVAAGALRADVAGHTPADQPKAFIDGTGPGWRTLGPNDTDAPGIYHSEFRVQRNGTTETYPPDGYETFEVLPALVGAEVGVLVVV